MALRGFDIVKALHGLRITTKTACFFMFLPVLFRSFRPNIPEISQHLKTTEGGIKASFHVTEEQCLHVTLK